MTNRLKVTVLFYMVGVAGLEPAASSSRTKHATKLRYTPKYFVDTYVLYYLIKVKSRKFLRYLTLPFFGGILCIYLYKDVFYDS